MAADAAALRGAWDRFYRAQCEADIRRLVEAYPRERSLHVDVLDLYAYDDEFTKGLFSSPDRYLRAGAESLRALDDAFSRVNVRLVNHPGLLGIGSLRARHVDELVTVEGVVDDVAGVQAAVSAAVYACSACGHAIRRRPDARLAPPGRCKECDAVGSMAFDADRSTYVDVQRVVLATPGGGPLEGGERAMLDVLVDDDLVETVEEGDHLLATGIVRLDREGDANRFDFYLDVVSLNEEPGKTERVVDDASSELQRAIQSRWEQLTQR